MDYYTRSLYSDFCSYAREDEYPVTAKKIAKFPHPRCSPEWENEANRLARHWAPYIYDCQKCGYPVVKGYVCTYCRDPSPSEREE